MKVKGDDLIFRTGRVMYANGGIIGIDSDLEVTGGYDSGFCRPKEDWMEEGDFEDVLDKQEHIELADHMIGLWEKFKESAE